MNREARTRSSRKKRGQGVGFVGVSDVFLETTIFYFH